MNAVLGMAQGLSRRALRPFVVSLRQVGFEGEIHLFVADLDGDAIDELRLHGVELHRFRHLHLDLHGGRVLQPYDRRLAPLHSMYPRLAALASLAANDRLRASARAMATISLAINARFFHYYDFLLDAVDRYEQVLLTDVRDVLFQRDPFGDPLDSRVRCFLEDAAYTIGTHHMNADWVRATYGEEGLSRLAAHPISCVGVTMGVAGGVLDYLEAMVRELTRLPRQIWGSDTAAHNRVCHDGLVPGLELVANGAGPVLTMGGGDWRDLVELQDGLLVDVGGRPFAVLHQYDRDERTAEALLAGITGD